MHYLPESVLSMWAYCRSCVNNVRVLISLLSTCFKLCESLLFTQRHHRYIFTINRGSQKLEPDLLSLTLSESAFPITVPRPCALALPGSKIMPGYHSIESHGLSSDRTGESLAITLRNLMPLRISRSLETNGCQGRLSSPPLWLKPAARLAATRGRWSHYGAPRAAVRACQHGLVRRTRLCAAGTHPSRTPCPGLRGPHSTHRRGRATRGRRAESRSGRASCRGAGSRRRCAASLGAAEPGPPASAGAGGGAPGAAGRSGRCS